METSAEQILEFAILQSVAECYLDRVDLDTRPDNEPLKIRLRNGNNHYDYNPDQGQGKSKLTDQQIEWFLDKFEFVDHYANDASGFSATVFRDKSTGEYTLSFRSLEYADESNGGDWLRDGRSGGAGEISGRGVAFAQAASMERYWASPLPATTKVPRPPGRAGTVYENAYRLGTAGASTSGQTLLRATGFRPSR